MKTKDITKFFKKNQTALLIALGVVVAVVLIWIVAKKNRGINDNDKELSEQNTGQSLTPGINWNDLVTRLRQAFSGPLGNSTDEDEVYNVIATLRSQADWEYLKRAWQKYCDSLPWWKRMNDVIMNGTNYKSLPALLIYELDSGELQNCRDILGSHGITPDF